MRAHRASRVGIAVLSVVALVASGASPIAAQVSDPGKTLSMPVYPAGIDIDSTGTVYVAGYGSGIGTEISIFEPGATTRNSARTLTGAIAPVDVEVHPTSGDVYVANYGADNVLVYDAGTTVPNPAKTRTGVTKPGGLAFSLAGNLLVSSATSDQIYIYPASSLTPTGSFASTVATPTGIEVQPGTGDLYVPEGNGVGVKVFDNGTVVPNGAKTLTGLTNPRGMAFHPANGSAYVSNQAGTTASVFAIGELAANAANALTSLTNPWGVAISPRTGEVYVSEANAVKVFAPPTPTVTSVAPTSGPVSGGTAVTVTGTNLGMVSAVSFAGVNAPLVGTPTFTSVQVTAPAVNAAGPATVNVTATGSTAGKVDAFTYTAVAPGKATGVLGVPGDRRVTVSWTPPAVTGGAAVTGYTVVATPGPAVCATTATSCTITGLANGTPYTFAVTTTNAAALSSVSDPSPAVTPVIAMSLKVKAKKASYRPGRWGTRTLVSWAKKSTKANRMVTRSCTNGTGLSSSKLCKFTVYKSGKVKVRTKGYRNVVKPASFKSRSIK